MNLGICSRSSDIVEPMIKPQWFVNCSSMAAEALAAVEDKKIEIIPKQYVQEWKRYYLLSFIFLQFNRFNQNVKHNNVTSIDFRWLENIRDWCISRQLWWGHRIPAWYVLLDDDVLKEFGSYDDHWVVAHDENEALLEAQKIFKEKKLRVSQDPDVLDTWFSSGIFPLSILGWPENSKDLKTFYPTSVLETGHDILFFWVARMVMLGMKLGGDVPFSKVYYLTFS